MARILVIPHFEQSKGRKGLRTRLSKQVDRKKRKEARRAIARAMAAEERRRMFDQLRIKSKKRRKLATQKLFEVKVDALRELYREFGEEISEPELREKAETSTLMKVRASAIVKERKLYVNARRGGKILPNTFQRGKWKIVKGRRKLVGAGEYLSAARVRRSLAMQGYWARVRALSGSMDISVTEARRADRLMLDVPEATRRRIYERIISKYRRKGRKRKRG